MCSKTPISEIQLNVVFFNYQLFCKRRLFRYFGFYLLILKSFYQILLIFETSNVYLFKFLSIKDEIKYPDPAPTSRTLSLFILLKEFFKKFTFGS